MTFQKQDVLYLRERTKDVFMPRKCIYLNRLVTGQERRGRKISIHEWRRSVGDLQRISADWLQPELQLGGVLLALALACGAGTRIFKRNNM